LAKAMNVQVMSFSSPVEARRIPRWTHETK